MKCHISPIRHIWALLLLCLCAPFALAQQPLPCNITITSDFESQCILPRDKDDFVNEEPETIIACQGSIVTYTAHVNTGAASVTEWNWEVAGGILSSSANIATVEWGSEPQGQISLTIVTDSGSSCSLTINVRLIEKPSILVSTVPSYSELPDGSKVIYVCRGETVEFTDLSSTVNTDIVGYFWDSPFYNLTASSPNFRIENVWHEDQVTHRVYNNCGCFDEEVYFIKVMDGEILDLGCYGTVCQDAVVTYTANNPPCSQYSWYVEGGTIIGAQDRQSVTVQWDNPQNGYGIIGLDGNLCGGNACPSMLSKKIPIIQKGVAVKGQDVVCVDEAVIYSVPLYGSTEYHWSIQPTTGISLYDVNGANQQMVEFHQPGIYHLHVSYKCDFLECGEFSSDTLTIHVKPRLSITGHDRICINNPCDLTTDPSAAVSWEVQDISNNYLSIHSETSNVLSWTFPHSGKYQVTASHPDYCRPAILIVTVVDAPPAPTIDDMDPENPTTACLFDGIRLQSTPQNPNYSIVWRPVCDDALPSEISGNDVTINYGSTICDIEAFTYDRTLDCLSSSSYLIHVTELQPANIPPTQIVVCPGSVVSFDNTLVPFQKGVLYEWLIQDDKQYCASIQGSALNNSVTMIVNEHRSGNYPIGFYVVLKRTVCHVEYFDTFYIQVRGHEPTILDLIASSNSICPDELITFTGTGGDPSNYRWEVDGNQVSFVGNPYVCSFSTPGSHDVKVMYNEMDQCTNLNYYSDATVSIVVHPAPVIYGIDYNISNQTVCVDVASGSYTYQWYYNGSPLIGETSSCTQFLGYGTYKCEVTNSLLCTSVESRYIGPATPSITCDVIADMTGTYDFCSAELSLSSPISSPSISWSCSGNGNQRTLQVNPNDSHNAIVKFNDVGYYYIKSYSTGNDCEISKYSHVVKFVPSFIFEKQCDKIVIHNNCRSLSGSEHIYFTVAGHAPCDFDYSNKTFDYPITSNGTYIFTLIVTVDGSTYSCTFDPVVFTTINNPRVTISTSNPIYQDQTCDNTPIELTANCSTISPITSTLWFFGDGTKLTENGNSVFHTFGPGDYSVTATITDINGCPVVSDSLAIHSSNNAIISASLSVDGADVCPGSPRDITFRQGTSILSNSYFYWNESPVSTTLNNYSTYETGDYSAIAVNNYFCHKQDNINVKFLNKPTAIIITEKNEYCFGEKVMLYGGTGPDSNDYSYEWEVQNISNGIITLHNTATLSLTPTTSGYYHISLKITSNQSGCYDIATPVTIQIHPTPAAPTIGFGSNECIDNPPVVLNGSATVTSDINWSNGNVGPNAYYFSPGMATAWYYDPNTGCKSEEAKIHIEPQPDFDALLTGCYEKCRAFFETNPRLPVWGLSSGREDILWDWHRNSSGIANGIVSYPNYSLSLPLQGFGDYNLNLDYHNGNCGTLISPTLTINPKDTCDCQDLDVSYKYEWHVEDCRIYYDVDVTVCNNSTTRDCLRNIEYLFNKEFIRVVYTDFASTTLNPGDCYSFHMTILVSQFLPSSTISFRLYDECNNCTTDFSINLMPEKIDCEMDMQLISLDINPGLSSNVAAYFDFKFDVSPCQNLIAFWSEPPMVINYWYDGAAMVQGLGMVDYATLTQLMAENGNICFYAITCEGDHLCKRKFCIPAKKIYNMLQRMGLASASHDSAKGTTQQHTTPNPDSDAEPRLMPNPTTGEVSVEMGNTLSGAKAASTKDEVVEVLVMDMNGRKVATFENTTRFNIAHLATGHYIVRLKTQHNTTEKVTYLKLIKK